MLPLEIWEIILKKFEKNENPIHLVRLKRVCKTWHGIITQLSEKSEKWYPKCQKAIPEGLWSPILEQQLHPDIDCRNFHQTKKHPQVFMSLYRSWIQLRKLVTMKPITRTLEVPPGKLRSTRITCVAALGNIIVTGDSEGCVNFYDITDMKTNSMYTANLKPAIEDVQLWRKGADIIAVISCLDHRIKYWDVRSKKEISQLEDSGVSLISASFEYCYKVKNKKENPILVIERRTESTSPDRWLLRLDFHYKFVAAGSEGDTVMLWMEADRHIKYCETARKTYTVCPFMIRKPAEPISRYLTFKPRIAACIGELCYFGFSIAGRQWKMYDGLQLLGAPVTSVLFHVSLLVLGLKSAVVRMYRVWNVNDLENFDFYSTPFTEINLDSSAIISLKITELNSQQYLVAATERQIHIVRFERSEEQN